MPAGFHARFDRSALCVDRYQQPCDFHSLDRAARIVHGAASCASSSRRAVALPKPGGGGDTDVKAWTAAALGVLIGAPVSTALGNLRERHF